MVLAEQKQVIPVFILGNLCFILKQKHLEVFPREYLWGFLGRHYNVDSEVCFVFQSGGA